MKIFLSITYLHVLEMIIVGTTEVLNTYLVQSHRTWSSAIQSCNLKGGSLLTDLEIKDLVLNKKDSTDLQYEDARQTLASPEFWIKEFKYKSPWISAKGCFSGSLSDTSTKITSQSNTVGACYQRCSHSVYFGTQGKSCKCFSETEFRALTEVNGAICNVTCPGSVRKRCGGSGVYDVYQTVVIYPLPKPTCHNCVNSETVYFSDNCRKNYSSSCGIINCPYCRVGGMNHGGLLCNVTDCQSNRTSFCRYTKGNPLESRISTTTVSFGILIGVLIGVSSYLPMVIFLKLKLLRQRQSSGTGESAQVYFTASGSPRTSHVYEGLEENEYVEPI